VFPLSNWTELDVWSCIRQEHIPVVPLYFARLREVVNRGGMLVPVYHNMPPAEGEKVERGRCRMRSLGCTFCTGAVRSEATTIGEIIEELKRSHFSERQNRAMGHDQEGSMELKKRDGYF